MKKIMFVIITTLILSCQKESVKPDVIPPVRIKGTTNVGTVIFKDGPYDYPDNNDTLLWGMNVQNDSSGNILYLHGKSVEEPKWHHDYEVGDKYRDSIPW